METNYAHIQYRQLKHRVDVIWYLLKYFFITNWTCISDFPYKNINGHDCLDIQTLVIVSFTKPECKYKCLSAQQREFLTYRHLWNYGHFEHVDIFFKMWCFGVMFIGRECWRYSETSGKLFKNIEIMLDKTGLHCLNNLEVNYLTYDLMLKCIVWSEIHHMECHNNELFPHDIYTVANDALIWPILCFVINHALIK